MHFTNQLQMKIIVYRLILLFHSIVFIKPLTAQTTTMNIPGVYYMHGVMETASVFELRPDSSFEFFFSQGALDRGGRGKWTVKEGQLILNSSSARPAKDYALVSSRKMPGTGTVIKMVDKNTMILSYSEITLVTPGGALQQRTDSRGEARFTKSQGTEIELLFRLCPDRSSVFTVNKEHNYFEFRLEPWIAEVFFENFHLTLTEGKLSGQHPLLEGSNFRYEKE